MRCLMTSLICLSIIFTEAQPKKFVAESSIKQVMLYSSGARVQRGASVNLPVGRSEISFEGLSNQLDQQTVQLKADANITLLSVQTAKDYLTERKLDQEEKTFNEKITSLRERLDLDGKIMEVFKNEEAMLIKNQAIGGNSGVKTTELKDALDLQRQRLTEIFSKELEIQKRMENEQRELDRLKSQLNIFSRKKDSVSYIVTALVETKEARRVDFQLLYNVKDAGWFPTYDIRLDDISKPLNVLINANVYQRSGETWKNIALVLSTGNPIDNATPSPLQPWILGFYDPAMILRDKSAKGSVSGRVTDQEGQPVSGATVQVKDERKATLTDENGFFRFNNISTREMATISFVGFEQKDIFLQPGYFSIQLERSSTSLNEVVVVGYTGSLTGAVSGLDINQKQSASIQTVKLVTQFQPTTTTFAIEELYSLETDGKTTTIGIRQFEIPAVYDYYAAPKTDPSVFLTARVVNWLDYELQSGEVSLYFEGSYLGKTYLDLGSIADTLSLSLGKDNGIKITRRLVKEYTSKKFIGSTRTENRDYEISVRNTKSRTVTIQVQDQFPVSANREIDVDDVKAPDAELNKDTGLALWKVTLAPGEEKKLRISYRVKFPKDKKVVLD